MKIYLAIITILKVLTSALFTLIMMTYGLFLVFLTKGKKFPRTVKFWASTLLKISGTKVIVEGSPPVKNDENNSFIYAANHSSYFDIPILFSVIDDDVRVIYKKQLEKIPIFGQFLRLSHFLAIDRENPREAVKTIKEVAETIKLGASVFIFPEGTRSKDGKVAKFKRGAFKIAEKSGKKIVPISISGSRNIVFDKYFLTSQTIYFKYSETIELKSTYTRNESEEMIEKLRETIITNKK